MIGVKTLNALGIINNAKYEKDIDDLSSYSLKSSVDLAWMVNGI